MKIMFFICIIFCSYNFAPFNEGFKIYGELRSNSKFLDNDYEYDITENDNIYSNGAGNIIRNPNLDLMVVYILKRIANVSILSKHVNAINFLGSKKQTGYRHFYDTSNAQSIQDCNQIISQLDGWTSTQKKYSDCLLANFKLNERRIHQLTRTMLQMQKRLSFHSYRTYFFELSII